MLKGVIVALDYSQFATYIRNNGKLREHYGYYRGKPEDCYGLDNDTVAVLWLAGWSENPNIKSSDIDYLKSKFKIHKQIPEVRIYGESPFSRS